MAVSGVRSSWLTTETNSSFMRSTSRRSVTSRKVTTAPAIRSSSTIGVQVNSTGKRWPSARRKVASRTVCGTPLSSAARIGSPSAVEERRVAS
jgi:hypothetical protein